VRPSTLDDYRQRLLKVLVHIQDHLDDELSLPVLADVSHFSPFHFHRVFRGMVGESVKEHVRRLRLERAAHRLRFGGQPVTDIAFEAGYESHEAFTRAFRDMFGQAPRAFRVRRRAVAHGPAPSGVHFVAEGRLDGFRSVTRRGRPLAVRVEDVPPMRVAFVRHVGPYRDVGPAWDRLMAWAGRRGLFAGPAAFFGIVHDDPEVTPQGRIRYDAAITVSAAERGEGEIGIQELPGGRFAVATHLGSYRTIGSTYARLCGEWLPASGRELEHAPSLEFYRNSPRDTPPRRLVTDLFLPLAV
jgi:AraC family transcriptional regulator